MLQLVPGLSCGFQKSHVAWMVLNLHDGPPGWLPLRRWSQRLKLLFWRSIHIVPDVDRVVRGESVRHISQLLSRWPVGGPIWVQLVEMGCQVLPYEKFHRAAASGGAWGESLGEDEHSQLVVPIAIDELSEGFFGGSHHVLSLGGREPTQCDRSGICQ